MKLPRFTVRRLMIVVALVGLMLSFALGCREWMGRRAARFHAERLRHLERWVASIPAQFREGGVSRAGYHWEMAEKYEQAARYPLVPR